MKRRSFIPEQELLTLRREHYAQYPTASFEIPYILPPTNEGAEGTGMAPIHLACATGNFPLLEACLSVFPTDWPDAEGISLNPIGAV